MALFLNALQLSRLAATLVEEYKKNASIPTSLVPTTSKVAAALEVLANGNFLRAASPAKITLNVLKAAVKEMQSGLGAGFGEEGDEGVLGERTIAALFRRGACKGGLQHTPSTTPVPNTETADVRAIRWWFEPGTLPDVPGSDAEALLRRAWVNWIMVAEIDCQKALTRQGANVIVSQANIDNRNGGVVADAHVGPPNGMVFQLRFDVGETWDADKFEATCAHEIGHMLGLRHATGPGLLMSPLYQPGIREPRDGDRAALKQVPWKVR